MTKFTPGMTCPGWAGNFNTCSAVLDTREDLYDGTVKCWLCGRDEQTFYQRENRKKTMHKCADCPKLCGARAERCGSCGQKWAKKQQKAAEARAWELPKQPTVAWCPTGLRGPGGAMELELKTPTPYRPAAWGRS